MANTNRFSKPVAFNTKNEQDNTILEYCKRRNFSGFAKKAMLFYIEHLKQETPIKKKVQEPPKKEPVKLTPVQKPKAAERIERMKQQVKQPQATVFKPKLGGF